MLIKKIISMVLLKMDILVQICVDNVLKHDVNSKYKLVQ